MIDKPNGSLIGYEDGKLVVPNDPIIPYIVGDGIGSDITPAMQKVLDAAIAKCYENSKKINWMEIPAGESSEEKYNERLPQETFDAIREYRVAIKGPLTTPVGKGFRSLNVTLRQDLDLYACVRPVTHFKGVPSVVKAPDDLDVIIFRENSEDIYLGVEFEPGTKEAKAFIDLAHKFQSKKINADSGIGIKPISQFATNRIAESAIQYAIMKKLPSVTIVHKGNIMKFTEGKFRDWTYQYYKENYGDITITEDEVYNGANADGKIIIKDRIADAMFQQVLLRPTEYGVIVTTNLNGDYISDACAAQVGGLGLAPGANIGDGIALFEATHGSAPKYTGLDKINPTSLLLSACMMLEYLGWFEAADAITNALEKTILDKKVTYDLARQMEGATKVGTSGFADAIIANL